MTDYPFIEGARYRDRRGIFRVIRHQGSRAVVRYESGEIEVLKVGDTGPLVRVADAEGSHDDVPAPGASDSRLPEWRFNPLERWMNKSDPVESEFFTAEGQPDALVRETIQNSLDAGTGDEVRVRFAFIDVESSAVAPFLNGLRPHLEAQQFVDEIPDAERVPCLIIEDHGTRGLVGDPLQDEDEAVDPELTDSRQKNDFYWFYRNTGRSQKSESDLGRWGLGKRVLTTSSRIFSFVGLTRREDGRRLLMGLSVLKVHKLDGGRERYPYGYFAQFEDDGFAVPVTDGAVLGAFEGRFDLDRDSPGLSIVIPWPKEELTPSELIRSTVHHYFYPIIRGRLSVTVDGPDGRTVIDRGTFADVVEATDESGRNERRHLQTLIRLATRAQDIHDSGDFTELSAVGTDQAPYWSAEVFEGLDMSALRDRFAAGETVALFAPVVIHKKGHELVESGFEIFLERDEALKKGAITYVRQGITISDVGRRSKPGVRALIVAEDAPLAELLGDSENPAHTEWRERSDRVRRGYDWGAYTVRYVIQSANFCVDELTAAAAGRDRDLLKDVFFIPEPPDPTPPTEDEDEDDETVEAPVVEVPSRPARFRMSRLDGGFAISGTDQAFVPSELKVRLAYEVRRGNPFTSYNPLDFRVDEPPVEIGVRRCQLLIREENHLRVRVLDPAFRLEVRGFDPNRDLRVHAEMTEPS